MAKKALRSETLRKRRARPWLRRSLNHRIFTLLWQITTELRVMVAQYDGEGSLEANQWMRMVDEYHRQPIELSPHELDYIPIPVPGPADGGGGVPRVVRHAYLITHIYGIDKGCPALASIVLDGLPMKQPILYLVVVVGRVKGKDRGMFKFVSNDVTVTQPGRHRGAGITLDFPSPATFCAGGGQPVHTGANARDPAAGPSPWYGDTTPPHDMEGHFHGRYISQVLGPAPAEPIILFMRWLIKSTCWPSTLIPRFCRRLAQLGAVWDKIEASKFPGR
jgi:hypothetical protein